jgi:ubiquinone/menaquinone biosynthesis C-methylase UbiE
MSPAGKGISPREARRFYDSYGARQDGHRHEDVAREELQELSRFESACNVFELGCGTGSFAKKLFEESFPTTTRYLGVDVSTTMVELAKETLVEFPRRARVVRTDGELRFGEPDGFYDRFVANYVFDLMPKEQIRQGLSEAHRLLAKEGLLCIVNLTYGQTHFSRAVSGLWSRLQRLAPVTVGGCRPIDITEYLPEPFWEIEESKIVTAAGVPSQVTLARRE